MIQCARAGPSSAIRRTRALKRHSVSLRRHVKRRSGSEGRISTWKTRLRMGPQRIDTTEGARIWVGYGMLAHNLIKISAPRRLTVLIRDPDTRN